MRLLLFNNEFPPLGGGTATANAMLLREWARDESLEIDLVTAAAGERPEEEVFAPRVRLLRLPVGIRDPHHASPRALLTYAWKAQFAGRDLALRRRYNLSLAFHAVPAGWVSAYLARHFRIPYVIRVGGADIPGFEKRFAPYYPFLKPVLRGLWRRAAALVVKSQGEVDLLRRTEPSLNPILIGNGVDTTLFRPPEFPRPPASVVRIVCVARLIERKGQKFLLEAVKFLREEGVNVHLTLVGGGDGRPQLEWLAQALRVADRVTFAGEKSREELPALYREAEVFALPSFNEGMSNAMLEAMASGLPVVVARTPGVAEVVVEGENGLTHAWADQAALNRHLLHLARDPALRARLGRAARAQAETLSWAEAARQYRLLFEKVGGAARA
jgi:glycosyltransferase involved in cell wall biosynthesis